MINKSKHPILYSLLICSLLISSGLNIIFYNRLTVLQELIQNVNPWWMNINEFEHIKSEINRLEKEQYKIWK